jgi:hypothetical protein
VPIVVITYCNPGIKLPEDTDRLVPGGFPKL